MILKSQQVRSLSPEMDPLRMGMGWTVDDLSKPQIMVESTYGNSHPGSGHLNIFVEEAVRGVNDHGGKAARYFATDMCDGMAQGHDGINYSLAHREAITNLVEAQANATTFDGGVFISSCDKAMPAMLMSIGRMKDMMAAIVVTGGVMEAYDLPAKYTENDPGCAINELLTLEQIGKFSAQYERAKEHALQALTTGCQVIVGVGGGRIMDQAKATAHFAGDLPIVEVPTSIATCAAFAPLSVMYTAEGASLGSLRSDHEVNAIVMDMDVICKEPPRYAASGIMDGMAKMIEIQNGRSEILLDDVSIGLFTAYTIAEMAYHVYEKEAHQACHDIAEGKLTKAVEDIAYLNVAVAGIVSGVSKGFGQTALGHETYELVRTHFTQEAKPYLHGEIVAIGDCLQLAFNGHPEQVAPFRDFMRSMNMPLTLEDIGIDPNSPKMENLFQDLFHSPFMEPTAENEARLRKAMHYLSAD